MFANFPLIFLIFTISINSVRGNRIIQLSQTTPQISAEESEEVSSTEQMMAPKKEIMRMDEGYGLEMGYEHMPQHYPQHHPPAIMEGIEVKEKKPRCKKVRVCDPPEYKLKKSKKFIPIPHEAPHEYWK